MQRRLGHPEVARGVAPAAALTPGAHLHVPEQLEDLHGAVHDVLHGLLADAAQRGRVDLARRLLRLRTAEGARRHAPGRQRRGGHGTQRLEPSGSPRRRFQTSGAASARRDANVVPEDLGACRHA